MPAEAAPELPAPSPYGLSLAALWAFVAKHEAAEFEVIVDGAAVTVPFSALTTAQVCELVVKPATLRDGTDCSYAELLLSEARAQSHLASPR